MIVTEQKYTFQKLFLKLHLKTFPISTRDLSWYFIIQRETNRLLFSFKLLGLHNNKFTIAFVFVNTEMPWCATKCLYFKQHLYTDADR